MAIKLCPKIDDEHAAFPHRLVETTKATFVICTYCDHWIKRPAGRCKCLYRCHPDTETDL